MKIPKNKLEELVRFIVKESMDVISERLEVGEWWILPSGGVVFADGDKGDSNHIFFVITHLTEEILDHFGIDTTEVNGYIVPYMGKIYSALVKRNSLSEEELKRWRTDSNSQREILINKLVESGLYKDLTRARDAVNIAYGIDEVGCVEPRDYAMMYLNWKRMVTKYFKVIVQTWTLNSSDLVIISNGIDEAWDSSSNDDEIGIKVELNVMSTNALYKDIPLEIINKKNVGYLRDYISRIGKGKIEINEHKFHDHDEWTVYEAYNKVISIFRDNSRLQFEVRYPAETWGEDKVKHLGKAASRWKSVAREIYNEAQGINEVGNPTSKPWKECFQEALEDPRVQEFIKKHQDIDF